MTAQFYADDLRDMHGVYVVAGHKPAHEIVREVVDVIARNTGRNDKHACLHIAFTVRDLDTGNTEARAAARRIRDLYRGPYERVFFTETIS